MAPNERIAASRVHYFIEHLRRQSGASSSARCSNIKEGGKGGSSHRLRGLDVPYTDRQMDVIAQQLDGPTAEHENPATSEQGRVCFSFLLVVAVCGGSRQTFR